MFLYTDRTVSDPNMPVKSTEEVVQEYRIQSIQEAALRVISRKGMAAATMQEIAEEAGVAKGTIYLYFRDRDELVEKTFERAVSELIKRIDEALEKSGTFEQKIRAIITGKLEFFRENREFFRLYMSLRFPEGNAQQQRRHKRTCEPQYQATFDRFVGVIEEAIARSEIRPVDAQRLALFIVEGTNAIVVQRVMEENPPSEEHDIDQMVGFILDGVRIQRS